MLLLGSKLILVAQFGNMVQFWDQWDAEASTLYKYYNEERPHGAIGEKTPISLLNHAGATSPPS
jgi:transposase InsO family protein